MLIGFTRCYGGKNRRDSNQGCLCDKRALLPQERYHPLSADVERNMGTWIKLTSSSGKKISKSGLIDVFLRE